MEVKHTSALLFGYGRMGKEIASCAAKRNVEICGIIDDPTADVRQYGSCCDVIIDFTEPDAVIGNVAKAADLRKPIVIGTTGWSKQAEQIREIATAADIGVVVGSNFSIGVQILRAAIRVASKMIDRHPEYDVGIVEKHHVNKKDHPSGTAYSLAADIVSNLTRKTDLRTNPDSEYNHALLDIASLRLGGMRGEHSVCFESPDDYLEFRHTALTREGFANGALYAASWIVGRRGWYDFEHVVTGES